MDILLSHIGQVASLSACDPLKTTRYWLTDVRLISVHMLETLHTELEQHYGQIIADDCLTALTEEAVHDFITGRIDNVQLLEYQLPIRANEAAFAKAAFDQLSGMERLAVLFSLIEQIPLVDSVRLSWSNIKHHTLQPDSVRLLNIAPKHMSSRCVFWVFDSNTQYTWPLYKFASNFFKQAGMPWPRFAECMLLTGIDFKHEVSCLSAQNKLTNID